MAGIRKQIEIIENRIFETLGIDTSNNFWPKVPDRFKPTFEKIFKTLAKEGIGLNPYWLQYHMFTCPSCGMENIRPEKVGVSIAVTRQGAVAVPYFVCPNCTQYSDEELNAIVEERIAQVLGLETHRPKH